MPNRNTRSIADDPLPLTGLAHQINEECRSLFMPTASRRLIIDVPESDFEASIERMRRHLLKEAVNMGGLDEEHANRKVTIKLAALYCLRAAGSLMPLIEAQAGHEETGDQRESEVSDEQSQ